MNPTDYILANRQRRIEEVALELSRHPELDAQHVLRQIEGWQRLHTKVSRWAEADGMLYPPRLALEQCSGQPAAEYKARLVSRIMAEADGAPSTAGAPTSAATPPHTLANLGMADLTGGMGVDFSFMAPLFSRATYVEQRPELVEAARHNFPLLGLGHATILHGDGVAHLSAMAPVGLIYLDPARRDAHGGKVVQIEDCEPDIATLLPLLRQKSRYTLVKLSPMLDLHRAMATLSGISEAHVFASGGECKELLLLFGPTPDATGNPAPGTCPPASAGGPRIVCSDETTTLTFTLDSEANARCDYAPAASIAPGACLYEPGPAVMKAGAFRTVAERYGLDKLHPNTHLYLSPTPVGGFPGRTFAVTRTYGFSKSDLRALAADLKAEGGKANLTIRNFPSTVAELRKKLKLREGGSTYLFATTDGDGKKIIVSCKKI